MKRILFILSMLWGVVHGQTFPPGYTGINARYDWLAGKFRALGLPAYGDTAFQPGQYRGAGAVLVDTTGDNKGVYYWMDGKWNKLASGSGGAGVDSLYGVKDTIQNANRYVNQAGYKFTHKNGTTNFGGYDSIPLRIDYPWSTNPVSTSVWTVSGTSPTTGGGVTTVNGATTFSSVVKSGVENWSINFSVKTNVKSIAAQSFWVGILSDTLNALTTRKIQFQLADTAGYINFMTNDAATTPVSTNRGQQVLNWAANDTFDIEVVYRRGKLTASMTNRANGQRSILRYDLGYAMGNNGRITLVNSGNFTYVNNFRYSIDEPIRPDILIVGNSTEQGAGAYTVGGRWEAKLFENYTDKYVVTAGGGERAVHGVARIDEIINVIRPLRVLYGYGVNDLNGGSISLFSQNARRFADSMNAHGIPLTFISMVPQVSNVSLYNDTIQAIATAKGAGYIDITLTLQQGSVDFNKNPLYKPQSDQVHLNEVGQAIQAQLIEKAIKPVLHSIPSVVIDSKKEAVAYDRIAVFDKGNNLVPALDGLSQKYIQNKPWVSPQDETFFQKSAGIMLDGQFYQRGDFKVIGNGNIGAPSLSVNSSGVTNITNLTGSGISAAGGTFSVTGAGGILMSSGIPIRSNGGSLLLGVINPSGFGLTEGVVVDNSAGTPAGTYYPLVIKSQGTVLSRIDKTGRITTGVPSGYSTTVPYPSLGNEDWITKRLADSLIAGAAGGDLTPAMETQFTNFTITEPSNHVQKTYTVITSGSNVTVTAPASPTNGQIITILLFYIVPGGNVTIPTWDGTRTLTTSGTSLTLQWNNDIGGYSIIGGS